MRLANISRIPEPSPQGLNSSTLNIVKVEVRLVVNFIDMTINNNVSIFLYKNYLQIGPKKVVPE